MPELEVFRLLGALLLGWGLALALEGLVQPGVAGLWRRRGRDHALLLGGWLLLFTLGLLLVQRPFFAAALALAFWLLVVMVNNAKWHSLREPFLFADFEYFTDALKHPRLYIPFLGWGRAVAAACGFFLALYLGETLESSRVGIWGVAVFFAVLLGLLLLGGALVLWGLGDRCSLSLDPVQDLQQHGLAGSLLRTAWAERRVVPPEAAQSTLPGGIGLVAPSSPHLVAIQSESFFDPRGWCPAIKPEVLARFDGRKAGGAWGRLQVPAWGANTVRSEFGFLSGLAPEALGAHRFNPYRYLAGQGMGLHNLAGMLRKAGYHTVFLHPYHASFYARDRVMPWLGFDRFVDISAFGEDCRSGPYVGDKAVGEAIARLLEEGAGGKPMFIFAVTMENHGPLHLESVLPGETDRYYQGEPPRDHDDLTIYLRHLYNADAMVGRLAELGQSLERESCFCFYGDHVPIMPKVYAVSDSPPMESDYLLWRGRDGVEQGREDLAVHQLAQRFLQMAGLSD